MRHRGWMRPRWARALFLAGFLLAPASAGSAGFGGPAAQGGQTAEGSTPVPGLVEAKDARRSGETARLLERGLPGADEWVSEERNVALQAARRTIVGWLARAEAPAAELEAIVAAGLRLEVPELDLAASPSRTPDLGDAHQGWRVVSDERWESGLEVEEQGRGQGSGGGGSASGSTETPGGVPEAAEALARVLRGLAPTSARLSFAPTAIELGEGGRVRETALLHASGSDAWVGSESGGISGSSPLRWEWTARWDAEWVSNDDGTGNRLAALRVSEVALVSGAGPRFVDRTTEAFGPTGAFRTELAHGVSFWRRRLDHRLGLPLLGHPSGLAVADFDGDELDDLFVCQPGGLANRLFLRREDGTLQDVSAAAGLDVLDFTRAALALDFDGDGDRDLALSTGTRVELLWNRLAQEGVLRFEPGEPLDAPGGTMLSAADADGDGDLDLYVCSYVLPYDGGAFPMPYHDARNGSPNRFYRNLGNGSFEDATVAVGLDANNDRFSLAASWEDFDDDGDPDLYVANDFGRNNLYRNDGGRFVDVAAEAGVEDLAAGMGVSWGDADGDGDMDLYVSNMDSSAGKRVTGQGRFQAGAEAELRADLRRHALGNSLFWNEGNGRFREAPRAAGAAKGRWAWGSVFLDFDNDGALDVFVPNGFLTEERDDDL